MMMTPELPQPSERDNLLRRLARFCEDPALRRWMAKAFTPAELTWYRFYRGDRPAPRRPGRKRTPPPAASSSATSTLDTSMELRLDDDRPF
jgi:hypothetical protein